MLTETNIKWNWNLCFALYLPTDYADACHKPLFIQPVIHSSRSEIYDKVERFIFGLPIHSTNIWLQLNTPTSCSVIDVFAKKNQKDTETISVILKVSLNAEYSKNMSGSWKWIEKADLTDPIHVWARISNGTTLIILLLDCYFQAKFLLLNISGLWDKHRNLGRSSETISINW